LKSLKDQVPVLDFIYLDVWYAKGSWDSRKVAEEINSLDWISATEFPQDLEYNAVWNHWAVDNKYGGENIKGFNSLAGARLAISAQRVPVLSFVMHAIVKISLTHV
jgi:endo-alpha-N-acetylgalactosaminidase